MLRRLLERLDAFAAEHPEARVAEILAYARAADGERSRELRSRRSRGAGRGFVQMFSVEAAQGREFDHVVVANVRPGAFPLWYAPEAFLFSPKLGMIPKENAGEAQAVAHGEVQLLHVSHEGHRSDTTSASGGRCTTRCARARESVLVTAWGTPTRGITAPELLEELR